MGERQPYIGLDRLNRAVDNVTKVRRAMKLTLESQKHTLTENQSSVIASELHSVIDEINDAIRYIEGTQNQ